MADSQQLQQGVVFSFNERRFGFIISDERSLFFHASQVQGAYILRQGDRVQFTVGQSIKYLNKLECLNIELIERAQKAVQS